MSSNFAGNPSLTPDGSEWVLVLERSLRHPIGEVWSALTEADQIPRWGPFSTDRNLTAIGEVKLLHINYPEREEMQGKVLEVHAPSLLVFRWGEDVLRWELREQGDHTVLVLRHRFADRQQAPSYSAGWHLCLDGLSGILAGKEMPSMVGLHAANYGYEELYAKYAEQLGGNVHD